MSRMDERSHVNPAVGLRSVALDTVDRNHSVVSIAAASTDGIELSIDRSDSLVACLRGGGRYPSPLFGRCAITRGDLASLPPG